MALQGQWNVTNSGAFTYTIPLQVPPGTRHVAPRLALAYSSQAGDGYLGLGWSVSGLSAITRCSATRAQDNTPGGVTYTYNDKFCLDGKRLIVTSGNTTYGHNGSTYQFEITNYESITASGTSGNGPATLDVYLRDGTHYQYGGGSNSRVLVAASGNNTVRVWALNQITDTKGNSITFTYYNNSLEYYISEIDYSGNQITFDTVPRTDQIPMYQAGYETLMTRRITAIHTKANGSQVLDYNLTYNVAHTGIYTHDDLASITECQGGSTTNCLAQTALTWQGSGDSPALTTPSTTDGSLSIQNGPSYASVQASDFNADGITDAFLGQGDSYHPCSANGPIFYGSSDLTGTSYTNTSVSVTWHKIDGSQQTTPCFPYNDSVVADINGDGLSDIAIHINGTGGQTDPRSDVLINTGITNGQPLIQQVGSTGQGTYPFELNRQYNGFPSDFDNDGFSDAAAYDSQQHAYTWLFNNGTGNFVQQDPIGGTALTGDFDGDGCTDTFWQSGTSPYAYYLSFSPYCSPAVPTGSAPSAMTGYGSNIAVFGDFNGDHKTDLIIADPNSQGRGVCVYLSRGTGFSNTPDTCWENSTSWFSKYTMVTGDFNGDGKTDIAFICTASCTTETNLIYISEGVNFKSVDSPAATKGAAGVAGDWNNDGAQDIWLELNSVGSTTEYLFHYIPQLMIGVNNGLGATTSVAYQRLIDPSNGFSYSNPRDDSYPIEDLNGPFYVPQKITLSGAGTTLNWTYKYTELKRDHTGRGMLGFSSIAVTDSKGNTRTTAYHTSKFVNGQDQVDFPYVGLPTSDSLVAANGVTVSNIAYAWNSQNGAENGSNALTYFTYLQNSVSTGHDLNNTQLPTITTTYAPDAFGNIQTKMVSIPHDGFTSTTTNSYVQNQNPWIVNELTESDTTNILGNASITRKNGFTPDGGTGLMTAAKLDTENPNVELDVAYGYDNFGNPNSVTESAPGNIPMASRTTTADWGTTGQFLNYIQNPLSQRSYFTFDAGFGSQTSLTDPNSIAENWSLDVFGRPSTFTAPSGATTKTTYGYADSAGHCQPSNATAVGSCAFWSMTVTTGPLVQGIGPQIAPTVCTYYDSLGRLIAADKQAFGGNWSRVTTSYDSLGRVSQVSQPYDPNGGLAKYTTYSYDLLDRVFQVAYPTDNSRNGGLGYINYQYSALQVVVTDDNGNSKTTIRNGQGLVTDVVDALNGDTHYDYDAFGDPVKVTTPGGKVVHNWFDSRGRKSASTDPDMGSWSYTYDALDELTGQTDNKQQSTVLKYDMLGRLTERDEADMVSTWTYDTAQYGIGRLARADCTAASGSTLPDACPTGTYDRSYIYDSFGRQISTRITWTNGPAVSFYYTAETYDSNTTQLTMVRTFSGFTVKYNYNTQGYLCEIADYSTGGGGCTDSYSQFYWQANGDDSFGHIARETAGNSIATTRSYSLTTGNLQSIAVGPSYSVENMSYSWDNVGNLTNRIDSLNGFSENFCYDPLNRLTNYSLSYSNGNQCGSGDIVKSMSYTSSDGTAIDGDIGQKSDTGNYSYTGANGAGPHAVTSIATSGVLVDGIHNPYFAYDGNGNMKCVTTALPCNGSAARSYAWTSFNMIQQAKKGSTTATFTYTPEHQRFTQAISSGTILYANDPVGGVMAERFSGSTATWRTYILAYGRIVAERFSQGANVTMAYFAGDHLTSTVALTNTNNQNAPYALQEQDSYDAWGKRRNINGSDNANCSITSATLRGFTSQEMMDSFCLVNLNGRMYDPSIGRMLSADPFVSHPTDSQNYNRYSYVVNNPLSLTDPTGFDAGCVPQGRKCVWQNWASGWDNSGYGGGGQCAIGDLCGGSHFGSPDQSQALYGGEGMMFLGATGAWGGGAIGGFSGIGSYLILSGVSVGERLQPGGPMVYGETNWGFTWLDANWYNPSGFMQWNGDPGGGFVNPSNGGNFNFAGLGKAFRWIGGFVGGQVGGTDLLMRVLGPEGAAAAESVEPFLAPVGYAALGLEEASQIAADVQTGVNPTTATAGAVVNGSLITAAAIVGSAYGGPLGGVTAGTTMGYLLPSNAVMGAYAMQAGYWMGPGLYGPGQ